MGLLARITGIALSLATAAAAAPPAGAAADSDDAEVSPPKSVTFVSTESAELEVVRAATGHLLVKPTVNGQDVGWFIFDTGAGMTCIDRKAAEKLNLPEGHAITATGTGGDHQTRTRQAESLRLGPVFLADLPLLELDLRSLELFMGKPLAGVIGFEVFKAAVFEVDFEAPSIKVHDSATYALPAGQDWADLTLHRRRPFVTGQIEGHEPGLFLLDIGANSALTVNSPAVDRFKLLEGRETKSGMFGGVGGMKKVATGTVQKLTICGIECADVSANFSRAAEGATADEHSQGSIGVGLLKQFVMVVNYREGRIALMRRR